MKINMHHMQYFYFICIHTVHILNIAGVDLYAAISRSTSTHYYINSRIRLYIYVKTRMLLRNMHASLFRNQLLIQSKTAFANNFEMICNPL